MCSQTSLDTNKVIPLKILRLSPSLCGRKEFQELEFNERVLKTKENVWEVDIHTNDNEKTNRKRTKGNLEMTKRRNKSSRQMYNPCIRKQYYTIYTELSNKWKTKTNITKVNIQGFRHYKK